jgi:hypothetical protein
MTARESIRQLADQYTQRLNIAIGDREAEMQGDDLSHYLIYRVLGISVSEGCLIDVYQNKGRFLYKYAGSFLEEATKLCFKEAFPNSGSLRINNMRGQRPRTFEIDCLEETMRSKIKWRDATTDGDHITKEHTRIQVIHDAGYKPIRVMFYYTNRAQAIRIQETLQTLYTSLEGGYYFGDAAWDYVHCKTGINLKEIIEEIANERTAEES